MATDAELGDAGDRAGNARDDAGDDREQGREKAREAQETNDEKEGVKRRRPSQERRCVKAAIPEAWYNGTAVIIGCGPSLTQGQVNTVRAAWIEGRCNVIVINRAFEVAPWANAMYAADAKFWSLYIVEVRETNIPLLFCPDENTCERYGMWHTPLRVGPGLCETNTHLHNHGHSGFQALNLAYHLRPRRILLLGYDCHHNNGTHYHGDHDHGLPNAPGVKAWPDTYTPTVPQFESEGIEVVNCSPGSALTCFKSERIGNVL